MNTYEYQQFDEERALYGKKDIQVKSCSFDGPQDGESALKECNNLLVENCFFNLRYPFWHVNGGVIRDCEMTEQCRAAFWYDHNILVEKTKLHGIKAFRECHDVSFQDCDIISPEFLWRCSDILLNQSKMVSEYAWFESKNAIINQLHLEGKYTFQYVENVKITNSILDTKDAFWHSKNVTVCDSVVKGEYLGWYSENLKFVRCKIIGTQPLCYCKGLVLEDCTMEETDLSFERSEVTAVVKGKIDSIKNPLSGIIKVDEIGELLLELEIVDPSKTQICCDRIGLF